MLGPDGTDAAARSARGPKPPRPWFGRSSPRWSRGAREVVQDLAGRGLDPSRAMAARLFGEWSPPAPNSRSGPSGGRAHRGRTRPAGWWTALLHRATSSSRCTGRGRARRNEVELPPPLAEPRLDSGSTGRPPELRGAGRRVHPGDRRRGQAVLGLPRVPPAQARRRDRARPRRDRDAHAHGQRLPDAGLFAKFFDADMNPLVEVVRDTVGRHDTFDLACTAQYYEDMGYSGHVNCSDNFTGDAHRATRSPSRRAGRRSTSSSTRRSTPTTCSTSTSPGRAPATTCCCGR